MDERRVLEGLDGNPEPEDSCATGRDPCVVETEGLAGLLDEFVTEYVAAHDPVARAPSRDRNGHFSGGRSPEATLGALDALSERTREQDPFGIGVPARTIQNVVHRRYQVTELRTADALVAAARRPNAYHDGTLTVRANPRVKAGEKARCCGVANSLNGSLSAR